MLLVLAGVVLLAIGVVDALLRAEGRPDLVTGFTWATTAYVVAVLVAAVIGAVLVIRLPGHPVGWLLLTLALAIEASGLANDWARYALFARPGRPGGAIAALVQSSAFITWLALLGLILLLTPDGRLPGPRWRWSARLVVGGGVTALLLRILAPGPIDDPLFNSIANPLGQAWVGSGPVRVIRLFSFLTLNVLGVLGGVAALVVRFRRARGLVRQQLLWVAFGAGVVAVCVFNQLWIKALLADSPRTKDLLLALNAGVLVTAIPVATGIAILQYHLYDLGRVVSRSVSYLLLTGLLAAAYGVTVLALGLLVGRQSPAAVAGATLVAASLFGLARRGVQDQVDRRFNRRRWTALRLVEDFTRRGGGGAPGDQRTIEGVLASALGDPTLEVAYPLHSRPGWVTGEGQIADEPVSREDRVVTPARRADSVVAAVIHSADVPGGRGLVEALAVAAATELDNARLRAEVRVQLVEVQQSRARIVSAGDAERRRIERNLHDGAQQRLVALGLQLRTSRHRIESDGDVRDATAALDRATHELARAVEELRELANGLHPAVLFDEGLGVALEELAERAPIPVRVDTSGGRTVTEVEATAFYVACEALNNAIKHAQAKAVEISACVETHTLVLTVSDDGIGGATFRGGTGLQGLVDRVEAAGGTLSLVSPSGEGTTLTAQLPCAL